MIINFFKKAKKIQKEKTRLDFIKELGYDAKHGYSILKSSKTLIEHEFIMELSKKYDEYGYMSQQLGEELDSLFEDKDYVIGIHRTGYTIVDDKILNDMFNNGLINNGHMMQGGNAGKHDIEKTVSIFQDFPIFNGQLKVAHSYKESQGCIIVKIPKAYLGRADGEVKPIYKDEHYISRLLPEFIYGYIPLDGSKLGEIKYNPNYKDIHTYCNEGLYYDDSVYYKFKREKGIDLYNTKELSLLEKYKMLEKAYRETFIKYGKYQAEQALIRFINSGETKYFTGNYNRNSIKNISKNEVLKILAFSTGVQNINIDYLITNFQSQIENSIQSKNQAK